MGLNLPKNLMKCCTWSTAGTWILGESTSEILSEFLDLVLEKDGVDQLDRSHEDGRSIT